MTPLDTWRRASGRSFLRRLALGGAALAIPRAGAFLVSDGDGWMAVYLVNSGPCDFYQPKEAVPVDRYLPVVEGRGIVG